MKRTVVLIAFCSVFFGACTMPPKMLNPVAQKNVANVRALMSNTETLGGIALKAMDAVTKIAVIQRERQVTTLLFRYINEEDRATRDQAFKKEVDKVRAEIDSRRQKTNLNHT